MTSPSTGPDQAETVELKPAYDAVYAVIREYPAIELVAGSVGNRGVFSSAFGRGQSVAEYKPCNRKAAAELAALMLAIYGN